MVEPQRDITRLLKAWARREPKAFDELFPLVLTELRELAVYHLRRQSSGHTLEPTALVNEAYLRLVDRHPIDFDSRRQFFAFASKVLRGILVDYARAKATEKRGGPMEEESLEDERLALQGRHIELETVLTVNDALSRLESLHERQGRIVELRYFGGLTVPEIAEALELSQRTVERDWQAARRWMARRLGAPG